MGVTRKISVTDGVMLGGVVAALSANRIRLKELTSGTVLYLIV